MRRLAVAIIGTLLFGSFGAARAEAQDAGAPVLIDGCFGVDHPPFSVEPPPGFAAASILVYAGSIGHSDPGGEARLIVQGPGGVSTGTGMLDGTNRTDILIGINSFGTYEVVGDLVIQFPDDRTFNVSGLEDMTFTVGPDDVPCSKADLKKGSFLSQESEAAPTTTTTTFTKQTIPTSEPPIRKLTEPETTAGEGSDLPWWILIILGVFLFLVGLWFNFLRRDRTPDTTTTWIVETVPCDWAAYYDENGQKKVLREAKGKECCVYTVTVTWRIGTYQAVAQGRQMPDQLDGVEEAPEGRLRIPDFGVAWQGMDLDLWASVRSGPAGRQDWMQADTPPTHSLFDPPPEDPAFRPQMRSHEEPPDVAAHLSYWERHEISVVLESMCPDHRHQWETRGGCDVKLQASEECSNTAPGPECPVEFTAQGAVEGAAGDDLVYSAAGKAMGDPDELEGRGLEGRDVGGRALVGTHVDTHDHLARPVETSDQEFTHGGNFMVLGDAVHVFVDSIGELDAGIIVPARVWDTTDRVSADVRSHYGHDVIVAGEMTTECTGDCCGPGTCLCKPVIALEFRDGVAEIFVDGKTFKLSRPAPPGRKAMAPGLDTAWTLT
ncbi:MAG: hypothetical protein HYU28_09255 [Actinobacteria bacterium]|nr:hypothetical protein [Actinomycetota bacterium]